MEALSAIRGSASATRGEVCSGPAVVNSGYPGVNATNRHRRA
jgi:hypothetical protein